MQNLIISFLFLFSAAAIAQTPAEFSSAKTSDIFVPKIGSSEILLGLMLPTGSIEYQGRSATYSGSILGFRYSYGFTENLAFFVEQGYANYKIKSDFSGTSVDQTSKGFENTQIGAKGIIDYAEGFFYYNANYRIAILEKDKTNSSSNEATAASARSSLNFLVGAGADINSIGFGALLGYNIYQEGDQENESNFGSTTTAYKAANGSSWKIYAQYQPSWKIGLSYGITTIDSYDQVRNGTTTKIDKSETKAVGIHGIIPVNTQSEVILDAVKPEPTDTNGIDYKLYFIKASYRMGL